MYKKFDKKLYEEFDNKAKEKTFTLFQEHSYELTVSENQYDVDFYYEKDDVKLFYVECEVKTLWKTETFPFKTIQIPERKKKFCNKDLPVYFIMWNNDLTKYLIIDHNTLIASPLVEVKNKYVEKNEKFFQVPIEKVKFDINELFHT